MSQARSAPSSEQHTARVIGVSVAAAVGGFLFGFDSSVVNGAVDSIQQTFGLGDLFKGFAVAIALLAPLLGAIADSSGRRIVWIYLFSALYVAGAWGLWFLTPQAPQLYLAVFCFGIGLIGSEFATIFTNALLPALRALPPRLLEAARSLGMTGAQVFFSIVFPQALRYIVPALVAQLVIVVKDTTFGYVVTYGELMQNAKVLIANYHSLVPVYLIVALLYCLVNYAISRASRWLGRPMH